MSIKPTDPNCNALPYQTSPSDGTNLIDELPHEVIQGIFDYLSDSELGKSQRVCKQWKVLASSKAYLKTRYKEPEMAFGKKQWEKHIGKIGEVPRLPHNINELLESPCPIWEGKKIKETHVLVYIPEQVNKQPHTINNIGKLVPIEDKPTGYRFIWDPIVNEHGDAPVEKGQWVLMTKDVLPGSRNKSYVEQQKLVKDLSDKAQAEYQVPKLIDAITCIFAEYKSSEMRLYPNDPWTYTRCQEKTQGYQLVVGGFAPAGLNVSYYFGNALFGVGALRKF